MFVYGLESRVRGDRTLMLLQLLANADKGLLTGDMARRLERPELIQRRLALVNAALSYQRKLGHVDRQLEYSPYGGKNVPTHRWWITDKGHEYLKSGAYPGYLESRRERMAAEEAKRQAERDEYKRLLNRARTFSKTVPRTVPQRKEAVRTMLDWGLSCADIGRALGLSRQRVHQLAKE